MLLLGAEISIILSGVGTNWSYFGAAKSHFKLNCKIIETKNINEVVNALKNGNLVISSQHKGIFTTDGHFIVLAGINSNEEIYVKDPSKKNAVKRGYNNRAFTKKEIEASRSNYWIFSKN